MSRWTNFRDMAALELGNSLIRILIDKIVRKTNAGADADAGAESPPVIYRNSDSVTGATTGAPRETTRSTGSKDG